MSHYDFEYAVFDEFGLLKLLCMRCGTVISERRYAPMKSTTDPNKEIMVAIGPVKNSSFREVPVELSDGTYTNLKLCKGCENEEIDHKKALSQILKAHAMLPIHVISCTTNHRVGQLMEWVETMHEQQNRKIPTSQLNALLQKIVMEHSPRLTNNYTTQPKFFYMTQIASHPITFLMFCKQAAKLQTDYQRFLLKRMQKELDLEMVPVRLVFRSKTSKKRETEMLEES